MAMNVNVSESNLKLCQVAFYGLNALLLIAGLGMMGGTIFLYIDKSDLLTFVYMMKTARPACILILAAVSYTIAIAIFGFVAAVSQNRRLLIVYASIVLFTGLVLGAGLGCAVTGRVKYTDFIRWRMREVVLQYYGVNVTTNAHNAFITKSWDHAQRRWYCCSAEDNSWGLYRSAKWFETQIGNPEYDRPLVPVSCCTYNQYGQLVDQQKCQIWADGPPRKPSSALRNEALNYRGCYTYGTELLQRVSNALIAISTIMILILICCLGLAYLMVKGIQQNDSRQAVIRQTAYSVSKKNPAFQKNVGAYNNSYA